MLCISHYIIDVNIIVGVWNINTTHTGRHISRKCVPSSRDLCNILTYHCALSILCLNLSLLFLLHFCELYPCLQTLAPALWEMLIRDALSRLRERTPSLFAWLLARSIVWVGQKLCRRPGRILVNSLSLMIAETQHGYTPMYSTLHPGNKAEQCEPKWTPEDYSSCIYEPLCVIII